jgi:hypothetical protein
MFAALDDLIEQRIAQARRQGQFDALPGAGRPLDLSEPPLVPQELRVANRILLNAGLVPTHMPGRGSGSTLPGVADEIGRAAWLLDGMARRRGFTFGFATRAGAADPATDAMIRYRAVLVRRRASSASGGNE